MGPVRVKLEGAKELDAALAALGQDIATKTGVRAVRGTARVLRQALYEAAPYRPGVQLKVYTSTSGEVRRTDYGDLRDNIKVRRDRARKQGNISFRVTTGHGFWGYFLEVGTVRMRPHPWWRPVQDRMQDKLIEAQMSLVWDGVTKATKLKARRARAATVLPNGRNG